MYEARLRKASADTQARLEEEHAALLDERDALVNDMDNVKASGADALEEVKSGIARAAAEIRRSIERAREKI